MINDVLNTCYYINYEKGRNVIICEEMFLYKKSLRTSISARRNNVSLQFLACLFMLMTSVSYIKLRI